MGRAAPEQQVGRSSPFFSARGSPYCLGSISFASFWKSGPHSTGFGGLGWRKGKFFVKLFTIRNVAVVACPTIKFRRRERSAAALRG